MLFDLLSAMAHPSPGGETGVGFGQWCRERLQEGFDQGAGMQGTSGHHHTQPGSPGPRGGVWSAQSPGGRLASLRHGLRLPCVHEKLFEKSSVEATTITSVSPRCAPNVRCAGGPETPACMNRRGGVGQGERLHAGPRVKPQPGPWQALWSLGVSGH